MATSKRYSKKKGILSRKGKQRNVSKGRKSRKGQRRFTRKTIGGDVKPLDEFADLNNVIVNQKKIPKTSYIITVVDDIKNKELTDVIFNDVQQYRDKEITAENNTNNWFEEYVKNISMTWKYKDDGVILKKSFFSMLSSDPNENAFKNAINYIYLGGKSSIRISFKDIFGNIIKDIKNTEVYKYTNAGFIPKKINTTSFGFGELSNIKIEMKYCNNPFGEPADTKDDNFDKEIDFKSGTVILTPAGFCIENKDPKFNKYYFRKVTCYGQDNENPNRHRWIVSQDTYPLKCDEFKNRVLAYFKSLNIDTNYELTKIEN